jgi:VanZ family protein
VNRLLPWLPAAGWAALLFYLSSLSGISGPAIPHVDKVAHFGVYLVLGASLAYAVDRTGWPLWVAVVLGLLYGASDEFHQYFVPGRTPSVADWIADALGVCTAVFLYERHRRRPRAPAAPGGRRSDTSALRV